MPTTSFYVNPNPLPYIASLQILNRQIVTCEHCFYLPILPSLISHSYYQLSSPILGTYKGKLLAIITYTKLGEIAPIDMVMMSKYQQQLDNIIFRTHSRLQQVIASYNLLCCTKVQSLVSNPYIVIHYATRRNLS